MIHVTHRIDKLIQKVTKNIDSETCDSRYIWLLTIQQRCFGRNGRFRCKVDSTRVVLQHTTVHVLINGAR